jgi:hypothetical protein
MMMQRTRIQRVRAVEGRHLESDAGRVVVGLEPHLAVGVDVIPDGAGPDQGRMSSENTLALHAADGARPPRCRRVCRPIRHYGFAYGR